MVFDWDASLTEVVSQIMFFLTFEPVIPLMAWLPHKEHFPQPEEEPPVRSSGTSEDEWQSFLNFTNFVERLGPFLNVTMADGLSSRWRLESFMCAG